MRIPLVISERRFYVAISDREAFSSWPTLEEARACCRRFAETSPEDYARIIGIISPPRMTDCPSPEIHPVEPFVDMVVPKHIADLWDGWRALPVKAEGLIYFLHPTGLFYRLRPDLLSKPDTLPPAATVKMRACLDRLIEDGATGEVMFLVWRTRQPDGSVDYSVSPDVSRCYLRGPGRRGADATPPDGDDDDGERERPHPL